MYTKYITMNLKLSDLYYLSINNRYLYYIIMFQLFIIINFFYGQSKLLILFSVAYYTALLTVVFHLTSQCVGVYMVGTISVMASSFFYGLWIAINCQFIEKKISKKITLFSFRVITMLVRGINYVTFVSYILIN